MICRTLSHAEACGARGTLVIPAWRSASFWPLICPDGCHLASYVQCWCSITCYDGLFLPGRSGYNIANVLQPGFSILCLHIDYSVGPRRVNAVLGSCTDCSY